MKLYLPDVDRVLARVHIIEAVSLFRVEVSKEDVECINILVYEQ